MDELKKHKNEAKKLFYLSVKKDIDKWTGGTDRIDDFRSPRYNIFRFDVIRQRGKSSSVTFRNCDTDQRITIGKSNIFNFKILMCIKRLEYHFIYEEMNEENNSQIEYLKSGLEQVRGNFIKEIRKKKLKKIK